MIDQSLLYPFSQIQTSKALKLAASSIVNSNSRNIVLLDKLTTTPYSETYRAYDLDNKAFVAHKKIHLDSAASWGQANLVLRQQQQHLSPLFAQTLSIDYDEKEQEMKVTSELQNTILKDYSFHLKDCQQNLWLKERARLYTFQIIQQLDTLKKWGIELEGESIDPRKIFVEKRSQQLKLYDFSDFVIKDGKSETDKSEFLEIAKKTLLSLDTESAELPLIFKEIETEMENFNQFNERLYQEEEDFGGTSGSTSESYDQFIFDKLLRVLKEKESSKRDSKSCGKNVDLLMDLKMVYKKHAEIHKSKGDFKNAMECYERIVEIEEALGQTVEEIESENRVSEANLKPSSTTNSYVPTSFSGKLAVLTMKGIFFFSAFMIAFVLFGLIVGGCFYGYFHLFKMGSESNQEEKK